MSGPGPTMTRGYSLEPAWKALLVDLDMDPARVLRRAGLPGDLFARRSVRLAPSDYFAFWRAIESEAGSSDVPVRIAETITAELLPPVIFAALMSPNLTVAAERTAHYKSLVGDIRLLVDTDEHRTQLRYEWPAEQLPPSVLVLFELVFWVALARMGSRHEITPHSVHAPELPDNADAYTEYLGVPVRVGPPTIEFAATDSARPFLTANDAIWSAFEPHFITRLGDLTVDATTAERVRASLHELMPTGAATSSATARHLGTSARSLNRRLAAENTTFQDVLRQTREALAHRYLDRDDLNVDDIAFLLGYSETSSFYRAFRNWTGTTPQQLRNQR